MEEPPLGLRPKRVNDQNRIIEILEAISRYVEVYEPVPREWTNELIELLHPDKETT